jgi:hypothetical protein
MASKRRRQTRRRGQTHKRRRVQRGGVSLLGFSFGEDSSDELQAKLLKDPNNLELKKDLDITKAKEIYDKSVVQINARFNNKSEGANTNNNNGINNNSMNNNNGQNNGQSNYPLNGGSRSRSRRRNRRNRK